MPSETTMRKWKQKYDADNALKKDSDREMAQQMVEQGMAPASTIEKLESGGEQGPGEGSRVLEELRRSETKA